MLFQAINQLNLFLDSLPSDHPYRLAEDGIKQRRRAKKRWDRKVPMENSVFERLTLALKVYEEDGKKKDDGIYEKLAFYQREYKELLEHDSFFQQPDVHELSKSV